ncbi:hypothetical protein IFM89_017152 [Coptis chinensis]|uniref:Uncharacterized protein n=1 Tax=Coptis chinensis TaxID=261450 RepID=A0A835HY19_9MAGN|nr:hypothetical protein IFM89_017152 [Coptis chinensis]
MGNCQAIDAASLVIQHPSGRVERLYWPVTANEVMKSNPKHYVALIITTCLPETGKNVDSGVRVTRVKLLKPRDILALGQAYRLISSQDVMKGILAKKYAKTKKKEMESTEKPQPQRVSEIQNHVYQGDAKTSDLEVNQAPTQERHRQRTAISTSARARQWRPSLQSISEAGLSQQSQKARQPEDGRNELTNKEVPKTS